MNIKPVLLASGLALTLFPAFADQSAQDLRRASSELAASLVVGKLAERFSAEPAAPSLFYCAMTNSPAPNADPAKARENMELLFRSDLRSRYASEALRLLDRLAAPDSRTNVFSSSFLDSSTNAPPEVVDSAFASSFAAAFSSARDSVCREQALRLSESVRPTEAEVESLPREKLAEVMTERIASTQRETVFRENFEIISEKIVRPMLDHAFSQRDEQLSIVRKKTVAGVAPSVISSNLLSAVLRHIDSLRAEDPLHTYSIFPSVTNSLPAAAEKRAKGHFREGVAGAEMSLDSDAVRLAVEADPETHRRFALSYRAFEPSLKTNFVAQAVASVLKSTSVAEANEYSEFIQAHLADRDMQSALTARVKKDLQPLLLEARGAIADAQYEKLFPTLFSGEWFPEPPFVDRLFLNADFRKALVQWKDITELRPFAEVCALNILMEETEAKVDTAIADAMAAGGAAREKQHRITSDSFTSVRDSFKGKKATFDDIFAFYSAKVLESWSLVRRSVLAIGDDARDDGRYSALFPSTLEKIRELVRDIFDSLNLDDAKAGIPPQNDNPPPPEALEEIEMECTFVFDRKGEDIVGAFLVDGTETESFACPHSPDEFRKDVAAFTSALRASFTDTIGAAVRKNRLKLTVRIDVRDNLIYYGAVSGVSSRIKRDAAKFGDYITSLELGEAE